jgi:hypothetical protein
MQKKSSKATAYHFITTIFFVKTSSLEMQFSDQKAARSKNIRTSRLRLGYSSGR